MAPVDQRVMIRGDVRELSRKVLSKGDIIVTDIQQQTAMRKLIR